jgi:hypothetical protein
MCKSANGTTHLPLEFRGLRHSHTTNILRHFEFHHLALCHRSAPKILRLRNPAERGRKMEWQQSWLIALASGSAALTLFLTVWILVLSLRLKRLTRLMNRLLPEGSERSLDQLLEQLLIKQEENRTLLASLENRVEQLNLLLQGCLQRVGLVRFDAFEDIAGQQSFSVALLDNRGNGVVITSLFGRTESRCYAKPVIRGNSPHRLSDEEMAAIKQAMEQPVGHREGR